MDSQAERPLRSDPFAEAVARREALEALLDASQWRLSETRWEAIAQVLEAMAKAIERDDWDALRDATIRLELAGPFR